MPELRERTKKTPSNPDLQELGENEGKGKSAATPLSWWSKVSSGRFTELDKDEILDTLHWLRQASSVLLGLAFGAAPLIGGYGIVAFFLISSVINFVVYKVVLRLDEEEYGGHMSLLQEGLMSSIGLFMLTWILTFSLVHAG